MNKKPFIARILLRSRLLLAAHIALLLTLTFSSNALAQKESAGKKQKLPSPEKIVNDYVKAIGGKKRVAAVRDATYEWTIQEQRSQSMRLGKATTQAKAPASTRMEVNYRDEKIPDEAVAANDAAVKENKVIDIGANGRSAWVRDSGGISRTLTDTEANVARLQSSLDASRFIDYKKLNILARTVALGGTADDPSYEVEFSSRNGARLSCSFSKASKLLLSCNANKSSIVFADYRSEQGILEPHQLRLLTPADGVVTLNLQSVHYNTGLSDALFDPPRAEAMDIGALLREVDRNQNELEEHVGDYTYTEKLTERKINGRGEVTEETVKVFEVYPVPNRDAVRKLISENGVMLSAEKAAKEEKRVTEELEKAERERTKAAEKREREKQKGKDKKEAEDDVGVADFIRAAELVSPRRERLREREAIVFDFRPRAGYKPKGEIESIVSKLTGVVWIDPVDKQVMRLEARLVESFKMGGGLLASVKPGTAFVFEQKRMDDGVWLPLFSQVNISAKIFLFKGIDLNLMQEFSNYQRFKSSFDDYKLTAPEEKDKPKPTP